MIRTIFFDIGGVLLSNAWDHEDRAQALQVFGLDAAEFESRHKSLVDAFEKDGLSLDEYLDRTVFYKQRPFTREAFTEYMHSRTKPKNDSIELARGIARTTRYLMGIINNESKELNLARIQNFGLKEIFKIFVSSCFVGLRKPEPEIYKLALELTQSEPEACCFIDDREANLKPPAALGMHTILMQNAEQLQRELVQLGVKVS